MAVLHFASQVKNHTPASLSTAIVAGTVSKALPLFAPHAPPLATGTTGTLERPCKRWSVLKASKGQYAETYQAMCTAYDSRFAGSNWSLLDPAFRQQDVLTVDHCLTGSWRHVPQKDS